MPCSPALRAARLAFKTAARRTRRCHRRQRIVSLLGQLRDPQQCKQFWDALCLPPSRMPPQLSDPSLWTAAMSSALTPHGPDGLLEAGRLEGSPPPVGGSSLAAAITHDEVISAACFGKIQGERHQWVSNRVAKVCTVVG